jgi:hypothetical protein
MPGSGRRFQPGQSGNPSGRPKRFAEVKALAHGHGPAAIEALVKALGGKDRVPAAALLLAYAFGRPRARVVHGGGTDTRYVVRPPSPVA